MRRGQEWLPLEADDLKELIGHRQTAPKPTVPTAGRADPLLNGLEPDPSLRLAVGLVTVRAEARRAMVLSVDDCNLKIGNEAQRQLSYTSHQGLFKSCC